MRELEKIPIGQLMSSPAVTVTPDVDLKALVKLMQEHAFNGFPVVNAAGVLQGMVSRTDLFKVYLLPHQDLRPVPAVRTIMTRGVLALYASEAAVEAMVLMVDYRVRTIPIVEDVAAGKTVVGVVTRGDLAAALAGWDEGRG
ncbi:MAG TPA: CBS domain-containing protein [Candidatus Binatia bacterium]|nr:CBS domain-containing protein [Candidatus Binatia bacterium]